jgi:regulator of sigma E protease
MGVIDHLFAVIPMLGILIFVHEFGHFLIAKACGVRVLKFSIGFGAPIGLGDYRLRWERSGTEYVIGWIPLGGFVRMLGEYHAGDEIDSPLVPHDVKPDEFLEAKPVWQKLSIMFAGPAMNLLLPILCLMGILWVGLPRNDAVVGMVEADSPAAAAGIRSGDRIVSLEGEPVRWWEEVILAIREGAAGDTLTLDVERDGEVESIEMALASQHSLDRFGTVAETGWVGLGHRRLSALVGVPVESSQAAVAGLRSGDLVLAITSGEGEASIDGWDALREEYARTSAAARSRGDRTLRLKIERNSEEIFAPLSEDVEAEVGEALVNAARDAQAARPAARIFELEVPAETSIAALGLLPASILVHWVQPGMPADRAGLRANDLILAIDGESIGSFQSFASLIQTSGGREMDVTFSREGRVQKTLLRAEETVIPGPYGIEGMERKAYRVGVTNALSSLPGSTSTDRVRNPLESVPRSVEMSWRMTVDFLEGLGKVFTGEVGTDQISGPIGIARIARKSLDQGWLDYVFMMMLISINLGILNLLPIPILDGGQILIYSIEGIKRSPVSMRTREIATQMGFAVLVMLMGRAFWNDLTPFWTQFVSWLSASP